MAEHIPDQLKDIHYTWPVLGYQLRSCVWVLSHVWYRRLDGCFLVPRIVRADCVQSLQATEDLLNHLEKARRSIRSQACLVAIRPNRPAYVWNTAGEQWRESISSPFVSGLLQPHNEVVIGAQYGPLTHASEENGMWFHVLGSAPMLVYAAVRSFVDHRFQDDPEDGPGVKLALESYMALPCQPSVVPYVVYGCDLHSIPFSRMRCLDVELEATQLCEHTEAMHLLSCRPLKPRSPPPRVA